MNNKFYHYCNQLGIVHETSCAYTPRQNGVVERRIGVIQEKGRALIIHSNVPTFLWGEVMITATYLSNRIASHNLGICPRGYLDVNAKCTAIQPRRIN